MCDRIRASGAALVLAIFLALCAGSTANAADVAWRVSKSSGEVSVTTSDGQQTALSTGTTLNPGDNIRTGQNGRALLVRGEETILISPNSIIGIPAVRKSGLSTIIHQAGSILLEVEKRDLQHFQVETPYLAAVVKGTQFRVTVSDSDSRVEVLKGKVEVMEFKSGRYALVQPGQAAQVAALGSSSLSLSGSGPLSPIQQGPPRSSTVSPVQMPKERPSASDAAPKEAPARVASAFGETQPAVSWSKDPTQGRGWFSSSDSASDQASAGTGGRRSRQEDFTWAAALSCAVGIGVALSVGALRRRKSKNPVKS